MMVVAAYDIREDGRRSKVAAILQSWGDRVQKSVFLVDVSSEELLALRERVAGLMDLDVDSLYFFVQCGSCAGSMLCVGQSRRPERVLYWSAL